MSEQSLSERARELATDLESLADKFEGAEEAGTELPNAEGKLNEINDKIEKLSEEVDSALEDGE